jgi:hypothetical protein
MIGRGEMLAFQNSVFSNPQKLLLNNKLSMSQPDVICLNTSHFLKRFNLPLLRYLSQQVTIAQWEYEQDYDEPSDMNRAGF